MVFVSSIGGLQPAMPVNITDLLSLDFGIFAELAMVDCHSKAHLHEQYFVRFL